MELPQNLTEEKPLHSWLNRLRAYVRSVRPLPSPDFRLEKTPDGFFYRAKESSAGTPANERRPWTVRVNGVLKSVDIDSGLPEEIPE